MLPAEHAEVGDFALIFIQIVAEKIALAVDDESRADVPGVHASQVGDLEVIVGASQNPRDAVAVVEDLLEIAEEVMLMRVVVQRGRAAVRRFDA